MKSLISLLIISVCVAAYFVYIKPLSIDIRVLNSKKSEYNDVLNRVKDIKEKRDELLLEYDNISPSDLDKLNKILPEKINSVVLVNDLNNMGSKHGIVIKDYKVNEPEYNNADNVIPDLKGPVYKTTKVNMTVSGQYSQFLSFLDELESALTLFDIVNLSIRSGTGKEAINGIMEYALEANIYSLR
jgi:Tfp pilus assembly protein PilO